jgi:hypothetical protein
VSALCLGFVCSAWAARALSSAEDNDEVGRPDTVALGGTAAESACGAGASVDEPLIAGTKMSTDARTTPMLVTCMALPACEVTLLLERDGHGDVDPAVRGSKLNIDDPPAATTCDGKIGCPMARSNSEPAYQRPAWRCQRIPMDFVMVRTPRAEYRLESPGLPGVCRRSQTRRIPEMSRDKPTVA